MSLFSESFIYTFVTSFLCLKLSCLNLDVSCNVPCRDRHTAPASWPKLPPCECVASAGLRKKFISPPFKSEVSEMTVVT